MITNQDKDKLVRYPDLFKFILWATNRNWHLTNIDLSFNTLVICMHKIKDSNVIGSTQIELKLNEIDYEKMKVHLY